MQRAGWAKFGRGTIDCGPGNKDRARVHLNGPFRVRRCETVGHFCGFGADGHGGCRSPARSAVEGSRERTRREWLRYRPR